MFLFIIYLVLNLRSCIFMSSRHYSFFFMTIFKRIGFEISSAVITVVMFFLSEIPIISRKLEYLCETSGRWVGESERMLFELAAYGHFH